MNKDDMEIADASWSRVAEHKHRLVQRLYEILLEEHPELSGLFKSSPEITQIKFGEMFYTIMHSIRNIERMTPILKSLGAVHKERNVEIPYYHYFYIAFCKAYNEQTNKPLSEAEAAAWESVFDHIAVTMQFSD